MELRAWLSYRRHKLPLSYWRSVNEDEVDFLIGEHIAIEVKASSKVSRRDFKGLDRLAEEGVFRRFILVSQDPIETCEGNRHAMPWQSLLIKLWNGYFDQSFLD